MTTTWGDCIVHDWKYFSKFYRNVNQIRQTSQFSVSTIEELIKRCCSCNGQTGTEHYFIFHYVKFKNIFQKVEKSIQENKILIFYVVFRRIFIYC
jgi:hypothetical protein